MNEVRSALRSLVELPPRPSRFWIGVRAGLATGVPFIVLTALGHEDIGLQTAAGSFVALYAATLAAGERAKVLPFVAVALFACAALGVALAPWPVAEAAGLFVVAVGSAALLWAYRLGPPGAIFTTLVYGLSANVTRVVDGERAGDPVVFLVAAGGSMLFAYLLSIAPLAIPRRDRPPARPLRDLLPGPWMGRGEQELLLRVAVASLLGIVISTLWLDPVHAYWTVCASVAAVGSVAGREHALARGLHRALGTFLGAGLYLLLVPITGRTVVLGALLLLLPFVIEMLVTRNYGLALFFVTPLVLLISTAGGAGADTYATALDRVLDTAVGAALGMLSGLLHPRGARPT